MFKKKRSKIIGIIILLLISSIVVFSGTSKKVQTSVRELKNENSPLVGINNPPGAAYADATGSSKSLTLGSEANGANGSTMYQYSNNGSIYCGSYNSEIIKRRGSDVVVDGGVTQALQETTYNYSRSTAMAQSIAYAKYYYPTSYSDIQNIIWASHQWREETGNSVPLEKIDYSKRYYSYSGGIPGRAYQFANFVYRALRTDESLGLTGGTTSDNDGSLKTMIDQNNSTYTVGPYQIHIANGGTTLKNEGTYIRDLVWNEIVGKNAGQTTENTFCTGSIVGRVKFQDGTTTTVSVEIVDGNGNVIPEGFPRFDSDFYIRYKTNVDGKIVEIINPQITINFTKKFGATYTTTDSSGRTIVVTSENIYAHTYRSTHAKYSVGEDRAYLLYDFLYYMWRNNKLIINRFLPFITQQNAVCYDNKQHKPIYLSELNSSGYGDGIQFNWPQNNLSSNDLSVESQTADDLAGRVSSDIETNFAKWLSDNGITSKNVRVDANVEMGFFINAANGVDIHSDPNNLNLIFFEFIDEIRLTFRVALKGSPEEYRYTQYFKLAGGASSGSGTDDWITFDSNREVPQNTTYEDEFGRKYEWSYSHRYVSKAAIPYTIEAELRYYKEDHASESAVAYSVPNSTFIFTDKVDYNTYIVEERRGNLRSVYNNLLNEVNRYLGHKINRGFEIGRGKCIIDEDTDQLQPAVVLQTPWKRTTTSSSVTGAGSTEYSALGGQTVNMYFAGDVWQDMPTQNIGEYLGHKTDRSLSMAGIQVELWDTTKNTLVATTTTNSSGQYAFQKLNPLHKYKAVFTYDGMRFEDTVYDMEGNILQNIPSTDLTTYRNQGISFDKITVELRDSTNNTLIKTAPTDSNGNYKFKDIDPRKKYKLTFTITYKDNNNRNTTKKYEFSKSIYDVTGNILNSIPANELNTYKNQNISFENITVELRNSSTNSLIQTSTTDNNGNFTFKDVDANQSYKVVFTINYRENYRNTSKTYSPLLAISGPLTDGYSTGYEEPADRANFNDLYDKIESSPQNYYKDDNTQDNIDGTWRKVYGLYTKLERENGEYIRYDSTAGNIYNNLTSATVGTNAGAFRYYDALEIFKDLATNKDNFDFTNTQTMDRTYYKVGDPTKNYNPYTKVDNSYSKIETQFRQALANIGVASKEIDYVWQYIMDTLIQASTTSYPEQNQFTLLDINNLSTTERYGLPNHPYLYKQNRDQSRDVDFGLMLRYNVDIWQSKDVYKTTVLVNGKKQEYFYDTKDSTLDSQGVWFTNDQGTYEFSGGSDAAQRAVNGNYNGQNTYQRVVRKSEYLYDGSDIGSTDNRNLQMFITYKIAIKNQSQNVWASVDEIVDYYDSEQLLTILDLPDSTIIRNNTYIGDSEGNKFYDLYVRNESTYVDKYGSMEGYYRDSYNINGLYGYESLYLTNIRSVTEGNMNNTLLAPGEITYAYLTYKVQNDDSGKIKLDQEIEDLLSGAETIREKLGKRNIVELNGYSTYIQKEDEYGNKEFEKYGVVDVDSTPGSLKGGIDENGNPYSPDIDENGNIKSSENPWENRLEDDTDKSPNLKVVIDPNNDNPGNPNDPDDPDNPDNPGDPNNPDDPNNPKDVTRSFAGYVFEDARTEVSDKAVIGNGVYNPDDVDFEGNRDKKVNGVTVQLVELVQEVDNEGFATGNYINEHIWSTVEYGKDGNNWTITSTDTSRYYSGSNKSKVILSGQGIFKVEPSSLPEGQGIYKFESLPPGDFFIRFIYGDTTQTVLTNGTDEVQTALNSLPDEQKQNFVKGAESEGILGTSGLNAKSYTGQDYKSTTYQRGVNQNADVNYNSYISKDGTSLGNGVVGYVNTSLQNYNRNDANDKSAMYNYSITQSNIPAISDAKDVYSYREDEKSYSAGNESVLSNNNQTLKNHRAEVLSSGTRLVTRAEAYISQNRNIEAAYYQREALKELVENTYMVAQTGIIDTEIEYNNRAVQVFDENNQYNSIVYNLIDIDLGLTERPRAQINLSKELTNIQIRLANGRILFDTNQSVSDLYFGEHRIFGLDDYYYNVGTNDAPGYRLRQQLEQLEKDRQEELINIAMDEELMVGATLKLTYRIKVLNIGEVDYLDRDFYYIGKTNNTNWENVSKTNANTVIDYVTNEANYEVQYQNDIDAWKIISSDILLQHDKDKENENSGNYNEQQLYRVNEDNDYINSYYEESLLTYNVLLTTKKLSADLLPRALETDEENLSNSSREVYFVLSTLLTNSSQDKNLIYTNLAEIIETSNTWGRRMHLSRTGDQGMPYQSEEKSIDESTIWTRPKGPGSDSAQKVQITAPTGENRDYNRVIIIALITLVIVIGGVYIIKKKVLKK